MSSILSIEAQIETRYSVMLRLIDEVTGASPASLFPLLRRRLSEVLPGSTLTIAVGAPAAGAAIVYPSEGSQAAGLSPDELARLDGGAPTLRPPGSGSGHALVAVPLLDGDRVVGWMKLEQTEGPPFDPGDSDFLLRVGRLVASALDRGRRAEEALLLGKDAALLDSLVRELMGSLELAAVVERIAVRASELVGKPAVLWLLDGERSRAVARSGGAFARLGEERLLSPEVLDPLHATGSGKDEGMNGGRVLIPLMLGSRTLAFLEVGPWAPDRPEAGRIHLLRQLAPHAASAIENARLHAEVRQLSLTDPLVQLPNRRQLDLFLGREFAAAVRGRPLAVVLYDLDRFKEYNDTRGHAAGDAALIRFAGILRSETRAMNLAVRYGGEEFVAVLSGTNLEGGRVHAERVRSRMRQLFDSALTVSAGVAEWRSGMNGTSDLLAAADRALYRAKLQGRDRVNVAEA